MLGRFADVFLLNVLIFTFVGKVSVNIDFYFKSGQQVSPNTTCNMLGKRPKQNDLRRKRT